MTQAEKMLQEHLNKPYLYAGRSITLTGYEIDQERDRAFIHTSEKNNHFDRPTIDIPYFLKELKPIQMETKQELPIQKLPQNNQLSATEIKEQMDIVFGGDASYLESTLKDSIQKLQEDPGYIKQATAINNNVNSLINITKMKIDFVKRMARK